MLPNQLTRKANKAQVAEFFQVSVTTVDAWIRRGCPVLQRGHMHQAWVFDLLHVCRWRFERPEPQPITDPDHMTPTDRKAWYDSEICRRKLEDRAAELIPREDLVTTLRAVDRALGDWQHTTVDAMRASGLDDESLLLMLRDYLAAEVSSYRDRISGLVNLDDDDRETDKPQQV